MRAIGQRLGAWSCAVVLLVAAGCGSNSSTSEVTTASIAGGGGYASAARAGKPKAPPRDWSHPKIVLQTSLGEIVVELDGKRAPQTVDNFLHYVDQGFYDQTIFHQVARDRVVIGGTYTMKMAERKTHTPIRNEADNGLNNTRGTIAMARCPDAVDSATSQFFFNLADNSWLDHKDRTLSGYGFCVFGHVVAGMDVLDKIGNVPVQRRPPLEQLPVEPVVIQSMRAAP
jgi:cyclophilin family peptidyl-prolyl cis-trans isomerase